MHSPAINAFVALRYLSTAASSKLPSISVVQILSLLDSGALYSFSKGLCIPLAPMHYIFMCM